MINLEEINMVEYSSGAKRQSDKDLVRFSRLSKVDILEIIDTYGLGTLVEKEQSDCIRGNYTDGIIRLKDLLHKNIIKYGDEKNWKKGIPTKRLIDGIFRHLLLYYLEDDYNKTSDEDHLASIIFGALALMQTETLIELSVLGESYFNHGFNND